MTERYKDYSKKSTTTLHVCIDSHTHDAIRSEARERGVSVSQVVRDAIEFCFDARDEAEFERQLSLFDDQRAWAGEEYPS